MPGVQLSPWNVWWFIWCLIYFSLALSIYRRRNEFFPQLAEVMLGSRRDKLTISLSFAVGLKTTLLLLLAIAGLIFKLEPLPVILS